jgi:hypothetical protein
MSEEKPKKKRFEGLIQFKDALRQIVVCLQASMETRFMTAVQSELVKKLDESTPGSHHLLFAMGNEPASPIGSEEQLEQRHLLAHITQTQGEDIRGEIRWTESKHIKASIWIDSSDILMANYFFWLVSVACQPGKTFQLQQCLNWGGAISSQNVSNPKEIEACLNYWQKHFHLSYARSQAMSHFLQKASPLLRSVDQMSILSDGTFVGIMVEGQTASEDSERRQATIQSLTDVEAHSITINLAREADGITQILMITPIREANKALNQPNLRGFVVLEQMRPPYDRSSTTETTKRSA